MLTSWELFAHVTSYAVEGCSPGEHHQVRRLLRWLLWWRRGRWLKHNLCHDRRANIRKWCFFCRGRLYVICCAVGIHPGLTHIRPTCSVQFMCRKVSARIEIFLHSLSRTLSIASCAREASDPSTPGTPAPCNVQSRAGITGHGESHVPKEVCLGQSILLASSIKHQTIVYICASVSAASTRKVTARARQVQPDETIAAQISISTLHCACRFMCVLLA